jgi:HrpA-like RNA helicase
MSPHLNITAHLDTSLPVIQRKDEIIATIAQHQVVVLAGEAVSCRITSETDFLTRSEIDELRRKKKEISDYTRKVLLERFNGGKINEPIY